MSLSAEADAGINLGGFSLETLVGIRAGLEPLAATIDRIAKIDEAYQFGSVEVPLRSSQASDSNSDTIVMCLGGPTYGRIWQLRRLVVGGALYTSSVNGTALVVVSAATPSTTPPLADVVDEAASLPLPSTYSTGQIIIRHPNRLWVVILSPTASTQYSVGGGATDMPDKRERIEASV